MGNEIPLQLAQFLRSILLGGTLALCYDLVRALRSLGGVVWESVLDVLVSFGAATSVFLFVMAEDGELRLFILFGVVGGAVLFFSLLSSALRPIWAFWLDVLLVPLHLGEKLLQKLDIFFKKGFSFLRKWFTIIGTSKRNCHGEEREHGAQESKTENASQ